MRARGGQVPVDLVFGARGGHGALVGDQAGERSAASAFDLRVDAHARGGRADDRVGLPVAELPARVHRLRPLRDGHAHRDARPPDLAPLPSGPALPAPRQVLPEVQVALRFRVDPLVEALVADAHHGVVRGAPASACPRSARGSIHGAARPSPTSAAGPSPCAAVCGTRGASGRPPAAPRGRSRTARTSTGRSSAAAAGTGGTIRSRWTRTTVPVSARG